jgi:hypothetical protein
MAIREANGEFGVLLDANNQPPPSWHGFAAPTLDLRAGGFRRSVSRAVHPTVSRGLPPVEGKDDG